MRSNEGPGSESGGQESAAPPPGGRESLDAPPGGGESLDAPPGEEGAGTVVREEGATDVPEAQGAGKPQSATDRLDAAADAFLAVEARLGSADGTWRAIDVEVVPAETVPEGYPRAVSTPKALELVLEGPGGETEDSLYLECPADGVVGPESGLGRLLGRLSIPADRFGDLLGEPIPVARSEGALVLDLSNRTRRGSDRAIVGLLGAIAVLAAAGAAALVGAGSLVASPVALLVLGVVNFVVLPLATYLDGWHLRTTTRWRHAPGMWALLAVLPGVNLVTTVLYLLSRRAVLNGR
ncbi:MAG: hypothetical protein V5A18_03250 [Haloarculaceae archaeon]